MTTNLIQIGNSQGIRIPKRLIEQFGFKKILLDVLEDGIMLRPVKDNNLSNWDTPSLRLAAKNEGVSEFEMVNLDEWEW